MTAAMRRLAFLALAFPGAVAAQGVRISGTTSLQFVELRQLVIDSALVSGARISATPVVQDLSLSGWGWVEGLSFHADLRARSQFGGANALAYPRSNDHFDVLDAYAELERGDWRARAGRQWITGGLGAYDFDGASALVRREGLSIEGWGGRALLAGLNEPYTTAQLSTVEKITPQQDGYIFGARARYRPDPLGAATLTYQRILAADRSGLYAERAAFDGSLRRFGGHLDVGLAYDLAAGDWNEARLRVGTGGVRTYAASLEVRHSRPFFELWTIWGAFAPVGFDEARATLDWRPANRSVAFSVRGAYRKHADANAGFDLRTNGWRAGGDVLWTRSDALSVAGSYDVDIGSGATSEEARAAVRWNRPSGVALGVEGSVTQNIYEFRVGTGRIFGALVSGAMPIGTDVRLVADAGFYQHALTNGAAGPDWTQRRVSMRLEWTLGRDPGAGKTP